MEGNKQESQGKRRSRERISGYKEGPRFLFAPPRSISFRGKWTCSTMAITIATSLCNFVLVDLAFGVHYPLFSLPNMLTFALGPDTLKAAFILSCFIDDFPFFPLWLDIFRLTEIGKLAYHSCMATALSTDRSSTRYYDTIQPIVKRTKMKARCARGKSAKPDEL
ncbi:hypothetical protein VTO42DRAFT_8860 [Malbranchea cinnamomea]